MVLFVRGILLLCIASTILLALGCSVKLHKNFAFTESQIQIEKGIVYSKLRGRMQSNDTESVHGAPYELLVSFVLDDSEMVNNCSVSLNSLSLENIETGDVVPLPKLIKEKFKKDYKGEVLSYFSFKNLNLQYANHQLKFTLIYGDNCGFEADSIPVSIVFNKEYSEEKISFWDVLMGV